MLPISDADPVEDLFHRLLEAEHPESLLASWPNREVAAAAAELWRHHCEAESEQFLVEPPTLVQELRGNSKPLLNPGQVLSGRFLVVEHLGTGGMGEVYLARDTRLDVNVAVKTIRSGLAENANLRRRFLAEVQHARQVAHLNVCRLFELFEDGRMLFCTMEYVEGQTLSAWLKGATRSQRERTMAVQQIAEGLHAAHNQGVIHGDLKPGNVMVTDRGGNIRAVIMDFGLARGLDSADRRNIWSMEAGTEAYMAPELRAGALPSVQTDIYAFGKVVELLSPGHVIIAHCTARDPSRRPADLTSVLRSLHQQSRRWWLAATALVPSAAALWFVSKDRSERLRGLQHKVILNAFVPAQFGQARMLRELLAIAVRQSQVLNLVPDDRLQALLKAASPQGSLPAQREVLLAVANMERAGFVIEGAVEVGRQLSLSLNVIRAATGDLAFRIEPPRTQLSDAVHLAQRTSLLLRKEFGESEAAIRAGKTLGQVTSESQEAVDAYLRGKDAYDRADITGAIAWFERALEFDPAFPLAHLYMGLSAGSRNNTLSAIAHYRRAYDARARVADRERLEIEVRYFNSVGDFHAAVTAAASLVARFPEEATGHRAAAYALARTSRFTEALVHSERAAELDPYSIHNLSENIVNHAEAGKGERALQLCQMYRQRGESNALLFWGEGLAHMERGQYQLAENAFLQMQQSRQFQHHGKLLVCGTMVAQGKLREAYSDLQSELAWQESTSDEAGLLRVRLWLAFTAVLVGDETDARRQASFLVAAPLSPTYAQLLLQTSLLSLLLRDASLSSEVTAKLQQAEVRWPSTHARGTRLFAEAIVRMQHQDTIEADKLLAAARGLWTDPVFSITACMWYRETGTLPVLGKAIEEAISLRGKLFKYEYHGLIHLQVLEQARWLALTRQREESSRLYRQLAKVFREAAPIYKHSILDETAKLRKGNSND